ncbi:uncharacterized protein LY79DRAFT_566402 [Colletotrichum navitas]|uniref:Uncharacterized protein n=1 Tax=Colletotrichum navitas TaxID=681940 RepID=A0AAD8PPX1_9PEZI|nr:uncharacterized protein LY79DRAFT_566402 [Colletotrichum navitas]KAK1574225.1 hypothetical protein LY79DRAFT_566402 [Colletotrichum navitas]
MTSLKIHEGRGISGQSRQLNPFHTRHAGADTVDKLPSMTGEEDFWSGQRSMLATAHVTDAVGQPVPGMDGADNQSINGRAFPEGLAKKARDLCLSSTGRSNSPTEHMQPSSNVDIINQKKREKKKAQDLRKEIVWYGVILSVPTMRTQPSDPASAAYYSVCRLQTRDR